MFLFYRIRRFFLVSLGNVYIKLWAGKGRVTGEEGKMEGEGKKGEGKGDGCAMPWAE